MPVISWLSANLSSYLIASQISDSLPRENLILLCFWQDFDSNKCSVLVNSAAAAAVAGSSGVIVMAPVMMTTMVLLVEAVTVQMVCTPDNSGKSSWSFCECTLGTRKDAPGSLFCVLHSWAHLITTLISQVSWLNCTAGDTESPVCVCLACKWPSWESNPSLSESKVQDLNCFAV